MRIGCSVWSCYRVVGAAVLGAHNMQAEVYEERVPNILDISLLSYDGQA